mgnify:CR=1 FL=1
MTTPRVLSLVLCLRAVFTEPWMTFAGVFTELLCREGNPTEFDVYLRLGAAEAAKDATIGVAVCWS